MRQRFDVAANGGWRRARAHAAETLAISRQLAAARRLLRGLATMTLQLACRPGAHTSRRARARRRQLQGLLALLAVVLGSALSSRAEGQGLASEQLFDLATGFGSGVLRGGSGGLAVAQRAPFFVDVTVLTPHPSEPWLLLGGSMRVELEAGRAVAGVARATLRHKLSKLELRPGVAIPFYFAPRTMIGPEANFGIRYPVGNDFGLLAGAGIAAFMIGNDVPHGTTVVMFHVQLGVSLFL